MIYTLLILALTAGIFFAILAFVQIGRRIAAQRMKTDGDEVHAGIGSIETAIFGLMGLVIGFAFFGAATRLDQRRNLIVDETNMIGTAYLRVDLVPMEFQEELRGLFREYLDARLAFYQDVTGSLAASEADRKAKGIQARIWKTAAQAMRAPGGTEGGRLLLPALNDMIDITTTRTMATQMHPPLIIYGMLGGLTLAGAVMAGYGMAKTRLRHRLHAVGFALVMSFVVYVIIDLEFPRLGLIRVDNFDQALIDLRQSMN